MSMRAALLGVGVVIVVAGVPGRAGTQPATTQPTPSQPSSDGSPATRPAPTQPASVRSTPALAIDLRASRQLTAGEGLGVSATIRNVSGQTVYIRERDFTLTLPLELEGARSEMYGYAAFFPTELHRAGAPYVEYFSNVIAIAPGDSYNAFWSRSGSSSPDSGGVVYVYEAVVAQIQHLFFRPGDYRLEVTGKYWTDPSLPADTYRTATTSVVVPVAAPQFVILFGAALGGLIAFFILAPAPARREGHSIAATRTLRSLGALGAMGWSVIVTILISRLAGTQFVVSVTINDLWGAVAIGFVANYAGNKLLERLRPTEDPGGRAGARKEEPKLTV